MPVFIDSSPAALCSELSFVDQMTDVFIARILARIRDRAGVALSERILDAVKADGAAVTGSLLIECILNEPSWSAADIDIFTPAGDWLRASVLDTEGDVFEHNGSRFFEFYDSMHSLETAKDAYTDDVFLARKILAVRRVATPNVKLDILAVAATRDTLRSFIFDQFDLTMCKNLLYFRDGRWQLEIFSLPAVLRQIPSTVSLNIHPQRTMSRVAKYRARGYTIKWARRQILAAAARASRVAYDDKLRVFSLSRLFLPDERRNRQFFFSNDTITTKEELLNYIAGPFLPLMHVRACVDDCGYRALEIPHCHVDHFNQVTVKYMRGTIVDCYIDRLGHNAIVDCVLSLFPMALPSYVLCWILEWVPEVRECLATGALTHAEMMQLIVTLNEQFRATRATSGIERETTRRIEQ